MYRGSTPRIVPLIVSVVIVALVLAAIGAVGRMLFSGGGDGGDSTNSAASISQTVLNTDASRSVRWVVRGPIVADEDFKSYLITISPTERVFTVYSGYLEGVVSTENYTNNKRAYEEFVYALDNANIAKIRNTDAEDLRGVCATGGLAYRFETLSNDKVDQSIWGSTCKNSPGSMVADRFKIQALFVNQIPDFKPQFNSVF